MKIVCINGSPKPSGSSSGVILKELRDLLKGQDIKEISVRKPELTEEMKAAVMDSECLVFAFPLYVDSVPSHLTAVLQQMEKLFQEPETDRMVYAVVNCGFYEGYQNHIALNIMKCWCKKAGLSWGQGLCIGGGGMIPMLSDTARHLFLRCVERDGVQYQHRAESRRPVCFSGDTENHV